MHRYTLLPFATLTPELRRKQSELEMPLISPMLQSSKGQIPVQALRVGDASVDLWVEWMTKKSKALRFLERWLPLIDPQEWWLLLWNFLVMSTILYNFLQIPIKILIIFYVFRNPFEQHDTLDIDIVILMIYSVDILLIRWRVANFVKEKKSWDYTSTYTRYLTKVFPFDVIAYISYIVFIGVRTNIYIKLLFVAKVASFLTIDKQIQKRIGIYSLICSIYKFLRLIIFILIVTNFAGCVFFNIDYTLYTRKGFQYNYGFLWLTNSDVTQGMNIIEVWPWYVWYIYSLYFAVMSTVSCGYGNLTARNPSQIFYVLIIILVNIGIFSYFTGSIKSIIEEYNWKVHHRRQQMSKLTRAIFTLNIKNPIKAKIRYYMEKKVWRPLELQEDQLCELLSSTLQTQFKLTFNREFSDHLPILKALFSNSESDTYNTWSQFARNVVGHMEHKYLSFDDHINESPEPILAMIARGIVSVRSQINSCEKTFREWQYLGQRQFFLGGFDMNHSVCRTFTHLYFYRQKPFFQILREHPRQREIYCYYYDAVRINNQPTFSLSLSCSMCEQPHLQEFCPVNFYWKDGMPTHQVLSEKEKEREKENRSHNRRGYVRREQRTKKLADGSCWRRARVDRVRQYEEYYPFHNMIQLIL